VVVAIAFSAFATWGLLAFAAFVAAGAFFTGFAAVTFVATAGFFSGFVPSSFFRVTIAGVLLTHSLAPLAGNTIALRQCAQRRIEKTRL
jgi:biotin transporter BioY